jgi:drug/metabolite transporter (DMT)-like permease
LDHQLKGIIFALASAAGFAVMPFFAIYAYQAEVNITTLLLLRFSIAALFFFGYLLWKKQSLQVTKKQLLALFILGGVFYNFQANCYFTAVKYIPTSMVALLLYTYPIFVAVLSFVIDKEKLTRATVLAIGLSFLGLGLFLGTSFGHVNFYGVILAIGSGFIYSLYIILGNRVIKNLPPMLTSAYVTLFAAIALLSMGVYKKEITFDFPWQAWGSILGVVLFSTILAIAAFFRSLELIGSTRASVISMVEPLLTSIFGIVLINEKLGPFQIIGGLTVLVGAAIVVTQTGKNNEEKIIVLEEKSTL